MCNIGGYSGERRAAPILIEMLRAQEGFCGGFFSGISTVEDGCLHHAKVKGNADVLCRETDAENFPGKTGIVHSRPDLGGDWKWAHPFVSEKEDFAYIANGHPGFFDDPARSERIFRRLESSGRKFETGPERGRNGMNVNRSELKCRHIEEMETGIGDVEEAFLRVLIEDPAEIVSLMVDCRHPGKIFAGRFNQPLMVGRSTEDEVFLATTALAFPPTEWGCAFPAGSFGVVDPRQMRLKPLLPPAGKVNSVIPWEGGEKVMSAVLEERRRCTVGDFKNATAQLWPGDYAPQKDYMVYEIIRRWRARGIIEVEKEILDFEETQATKFHIRFL